MRPRRQRRPLRAGRESCSDRMGWKVPIVSHRGLVVGRFTELAGLNAREVVFIETDSFFGKLSPVGERVLGVSELDVKGPADVTRLVGVANAYDALHLSLAIERVGHTRS